jgi:small conductance mechanosensitive channel
VIEHLQLKSVHLGRRADPEWQRRAATLAGIATSFVTAAVVFIAILMVLRELAIDIVPILTGAGIAGLAVGFGAQNLVRDVISGFFLILEDQIRVGDTVRVNGVAGTVEQINLRTVLLRDLEGAVHVFPNGAITTLSNSSKDFSYAVVDFAVPRGENVDRIVAALQGLGRAMQEDPRYGPLLLAPLDVLGVESFSAAQVTIRTRFKTLPLRHAEIARELRRRIVMDLGPRMVAQGEPPPPS